MYDLFLNTQRSTKRTVRKSRDSAVSVDTLHILCLFFNAVRLIKRAMKGTLMQPNMVPVLGTGVTSEVTPVHNTSTTETASAFQTEINLQDPCFIHVCIP